MRQNRSLPERVFIFIFTVFLALGAIIVTLNREKFNFDGFNRWLLYGDLEISMLGESNAFSHTGGENATFAVMPHGAVMVSQVGTRYYSYTGHVFEERVVSYKNPMLHCGKEATVLYDAGGQGLVVYGKEEELFALNKGVDEMILSARMNQNDWLVVVSQESGYRGVVRVYNNSYEPVMDIALSTNYVMDAFLSPDNKKVALITISQDGGVFTSTLHIYAVGTEVAEQTVVLSGEVVLDFDYEKEQIWLLCEKSLVIVSTADYSQKKWSFSGQYLKDSTLGGDGYGTLLLGEYRAGTANRLVTIDGNGDILGELTIGSTPLALDSNGNYISYLSGEKLLIYTKDLEEYAQLEDIHHANEVAISVDGTVLLASKQEAWLYLPIT